MRVSVVINTYNRAASLRATLDALRHQHHPDFEVVVVNGPSDDGTDALLDQRADDLRVVDCPERNLAVSRNLGIDAAAGDVVAFIDDDAVPEARWLSDLAAAYDDDGVGGAGGLVLDHTGVHAQYRYSLCDRVGRTNFDGRPPFGAANRPGANPFLYLQGTNCSFRRSALEAIEGFDEEIEYNYDEAEVCVRMIDAGLRLSPLEGAVVHHKFLPSHMRRKEGFTDPFFAIKNRVYFALRVGRDHYDRLATLTSLTAYVADVKVWTRGAADRGEFTEEQAEHFEARAAAGFAIGLERGAAGIRRGREFAPVQPEVFHPYPTRTPSGRRLTVCFVSQDYPPRPLGGIGRFTHDLARGFGAVGHDAHVITRDDAHPYRLDFEEGVWVHRFPVGRRWAPALRDSPLRHNLEHAAAVHGAIQRLAERVPIDVVTGSLWTAEPLLAALDGRWPVTVACNTPMRKVAELQPETAAAELTAHQIELEDALLRSPAVLQPVSHENARLVAEVTDKPLEVIWHGVVDRRDDFPVTRAQGSGVEILFAGRLEPRKGIDVLLEAAAGLLREHLDARLVVAGADNPHANGRPGVFADWVAQHAADVADRIAFRGHVTDDELYAAYAGCDVFCAPSRYESFGLVHVEAMMMGRPVVACDVGGMRETVVDGETGLLVAPGDAESLRVALRALVADAELRERMGAAGRRRYEDEFRNEIAVERNAALFASLEPPPPGNLAAVLEEVCGLPDFAAADAAEVLLDPHAFPIDHEAGVRAALLRDDRGFVEGVFETLLGRAAHQDGTASYVPRLWAGEDRLSLVREIASSPEARARGVDPRFLRALIDRGLPLELRDVGAAWLHDRDAAFAAELGRALGSPEAGEAIRAALASGETREQAVRPQLERIEVAGRLGAWVAQLGSLRSERELAAAVLALDDAGDREFLEGVYLHVLGRPADADGIAGFLAALAAGRTRAQVLRELVLSDEGAGRGLTAATADHLAARIDRRGRVRSRALAARDAMVGRRAAERSLDAARARIEEAVERTSPWPGLAALALRLDDLAARLEGVTGDSRDDLGSRLDEVERRQDISTRRASEDADRTGGHLVTLTESLEALAAQVEVMARKHEAMAMDVRERLPVISDAPEPEIRDPEALSGGPLRLNLGCGEKPLDGYVNVDFRPLDGVDVVADVARLPFEPETVTEIASYHLIEHFRQHYAATVLLPYWRTLLAADGCLRIVTPNWEVLMEQLSEGVLTFGQFKQVTFGLQDYSGDDHFAMYGPETLSELVRGAGFGGLEIVETRRQNGLSPELELTARPA